MMHEAVFGPSFFAQIFHHAACIFRASYACEKE